MNWFVLDSKEIDPYVLTNTAYSKQFVWQMEFTWQ
jgi:hypothetical protein